MLDRFTDHERIMKSPREGRELTPTAYNLPLKRSGQLSESNTQHERSTAGAVVPFYMEYVFGACFGSYPRIYEPKFFSAGDGSIFYLIKADFCVFCLFVLVDFANCWYWYLLIIYK